MRLHNFFTEEKLADTKEVAVSDADLLHQWSKVFRFKTGDQVVLLDNTGYEYISEFVSLTKSEAKLAIFEQRENRNVPQRDVWLYQSVVKKDTFEWIAEKATELGVSHIVPVISERSEKKNLNEVRLRKIIKEASEQSGRGVLPTLLPIATLEEAISNIKMPAIAFHLEGEIFFRDAFASEKSVAIFIGPEGGWSEKEVVLFQEKEIKIFSLGTQVLRAETAAVSALALTLL